MAIDVFIISQLTVRSLYTHSFIHSFVSTWRVHFWTKLSINSCRLIGFYHRSIGSLDLWFLYFVLYFTYESNNQITLVGCVHNFKIMVVKQLIGVPAKTRH